MKSSVLPKALLAGAIAFAGAFLLAGSALAQPGAWFGIGQAYRPASADTQVVARVDGLAITRGDIRIERALIDLNNDVSPIKLADDDKSILDRLIGERSLVAEARRRSLFPSDSDTQAYIAEVRRSFHAQPRSLADLGQFLSGLGQTEDAFFSSAFAREHYAYGLAVTRLNRQVTAGAVGVSAGSVWTAFQDATRASAKIHVIDATLR